MKNERNNDESGKKKALNAKKNGLRMSCILAVSVSLLVAALFVGMNVINNRSFREKFYHVTSSKVNDDIRIIQLSDLHSCCYGENNRELVCRLQILSPDVIVMTGDMINDDDQELQVVTELCKRLIDIAPVYYVYGNNEVKYSYGLDDLYLETVDGYFGQTEGSRDMDIFRKCPDELRDTLEGIGVKVLLNESDTLRVKGSEVKIFGILTTNEYSFWQYAEKKYRQFKDGGRGFELLLCHEPYLFEYFEGEGAADVVLCGHTHGGLMRFPIVGGLYDHRHGLLPEYRKRNLIYGEYEMADYPLFVSSGLSNTGIPRINNKPELTVLDVIAY